MFRIVAKNLIKASASAGVAMYGYTFYYLSNIPVPPRIVSKKDIKKTVDYDHNAPIVVLYSYEACPFCHKVRAYLDYRKIPYLVVEVGPILKSELKWMPGRRKVPVVVVNGVPVTGSNDIIENLESLLGKSEATTPILKSDSYKFIDNRLVHLLLANIYSNWNESLDTFAYLQQHNFSRNMFMQAGTALFGASIMYMIVKKKNKSRGITEPRDQLYSELEAFLKERNDLYAATVKSHKKKENADEILDVAAFGVIRSIRGQKTFSDISSNVPSFNAWFNRMEASVGEASLVNRLFERVE